MQQYQMTKNVLLKDVDEATASEYYVQLIRRLNAGVEVRLDAGDGRGKGVFATKPYKKGDVLWREMHLVAGQHTDSQEQCLNCGRCFRFIGSVEHQVAKLLLQLISSLTDPEAEPELEQELHARLALIQSNVDADYLQALLSGAAKLPMSDQIAVPLPVPCLGGCSEQYCGEGCRQAAWQEQHQVLCTGPVAHGATAAGPSSSSAAAGSSSAAATSSWDACGSGSSSGSSSRAGAACIASTAAAGCAAGPTEPVSLQELGIAVDRQALQQFVQHAEQSNDILLVAAKLLVATLLQAARQLHDSREQPGTSEWHEAQQRALQAAWLPFALGWKAPWWRVVARPDDVEDEEGFRDELRQLASESLGLLAAAVQAPAFPELFDLEVFASVVGMFELNNLSLEVPSPVEDYFLMVDDLEGQEDGAAVKAATEPLLDALDTEYDTPCEGTAFYALQSCINHSCAPNAQAETDTTGEAVLLACQPISVGQELTISYIDEELPLRERRAALTDYGFLCACAKCEREQAAAAAKRRGGGKVGRRR